MTTKKIIIGVMGPGLDSPGLASPGLASPGVATPGLDGPGPAGESLASSGVVTPGADTPGVDTSGVDTSGTSAIGDTSEEIINRQVLVDAYLLGKAFAGEGWLTLSGGRNVGVMDAVSRGAKEHGGTTIGILPDDHRQHMSDFVDIPILTGMGSARNNINVLTSDVVVACGIGAGTLSEIALALKAGKPVILMHLADEGVAFLRSLDTRQQLHTVHSVREAINKIKQLIDNK